MVKKFLKYPTNPQIIGSKIFDIQIYVFQIYVGTTSAKNYFWRHLVIKILNKLSRYFGHHLLIIRINQFRIWRHSLLSGHFYRISIEFNWKKEQKMFLAILTRKIWFLVFPSFLKKVYLPESFESSIVGSTISPHWHIKEDN